MAVCVELRSDGTLAPTGNDVASCAGYVLVSGSAYGVVNTFSTLFARPDSQQAAGWLVGAFGFVMVMFLTGRCVGAVANFFDK